jgi:predicted nuclease with TOPRIM domain
MQKVAVTVEEEHLYEMKAIQYIHDCDSRSAAFRRLIAEYDETRQEYDSLKAEYDELQTELEAVKNERKTLIRDREEKQELVKYVEREKDMQERYREAGIVTKAKWAIFGMDSNDE